MRTSRLQKIIAEQKLRRKRSFVKLGLVLALLLLAMAGYALVSHFDILDQGKKALGLPSDRKKINILVLGIDKRRNDIGRSNVTCVVTVNTETKEVTMLWIPRDSRVKVPDHGWTKIGHAYAYEGPKLSIKTVENLLGIPIDYYVTINMAGFSKVIDAIGGVDINVEKRMYYYDPYDEGEVDDNNGLIDLKPGMQHMDGNTALQYVRFRHDENGDIGRIERQQKFAKALLAQLASPVIITKIPGIIDEVNTAVHTDMPINQMVSLGKMINDAYKQGLHTETVPGKPIYIDNISYWLPDIEAMRKQVATIQGINLDNNYLAAAAQLQQEYVNSVPATKAADTTTLPKTTVNNTTGTASGKNKVQVINASGQTGYGAKVAAIMTSRGYVVTQVTNGPLRKTTAIVLPSGNAGLATKLEELPFKYILQTNNEEVKDGPIFVIIGQDYTP